MGIKSTALPTAKNLYTEGGQNTTTYGSFDGGELTKPLFLSRNPIYDNEATNKHYVDEEVLLAKQLADEKIAALEEELKKKTGFTYDIVDELPDPNDAVDGKCYLQPLQDGSGYAEYIRINVGTEEEPDYRMEMLGTTAGQMPASTEATYDEETGTYDIPWSNTQILTDYASGRRQLVVFGSKLFELASVPTANQASFRHLGLSKEEVLTVKTVDGVKTTELTINTEEWDTYDD